MRARRAAIALALAGAAMATADLAPAMAGEAEDLAAARALFERNLDSIRRRDRDAYLPCYLQSPRLVRTGPQGLSLGYDEVARTAGEGWPDVFDAQDLRLTWLGPGWVYGTYRYRVRYLDDQGGDDEQIGLSERLFRETADGWKIAASTAFESPPGMPPPPRALVGATLVDGTGAPPVADAVVLLRDGKVECAGPRAKCPLPDGIGVVDLRGHWITPGLIDAHVHFAQTGWADGRPDALDVRDRHPYEAAVAELRAHPDKFFRSLLCSGVTAAFDVGGYPWTLRLGERAALDSRAPRVAAAGPLLSTLDHWVNLPGERQFLYLSDEESARGGARYLASEGAAAAKVWFIVTGERPFAEIEAAVHAAGDEARRAGLPLIVHATGLAEAKVALRAGARLLVHSVWDQAVDDEFLRLAKEAGTVYCPTLTVARGYVRMFEAAAAGRAPQVDDPNGCVHPSVLARVAETAGLGAKALAAERLSALAARISTEERVAAENLRRVRDAGVPIALGTDAGNPLTLHGPSVYAEAEAMQAAGMTAMEVLVAATRGAARAMGKEKELGTVEAGKAADLLVLAADPTRDIGNLRQLRSVVRGGELRAVAELRPPSPPPTRPVN